MSAIEMDAKTIAHCWAELWSASGGLAIVDELVAPDFVSHSAPLACQQDQTASRPGCRSFAMPSTACTRRWTM